MTIENFTFIEAFYTTIIVMSTVGMGTPHKLSEAGYIFTIVMLMFSFGIFAYVISSITRLFLEGEISERYKQYKNAKKIVNMNEHVIVCGYGRNGKQAVSELNNYGEVVVVIEKNQRVLNELKNIKSIVYIHGDATEDATMKKANIDVAKALITTLPDDASNLFVVLTAKVMNPNIKIISRASNENSDIKLKRAGATNVIMPDRVGGSRMAKLVSQPDIVEFVDTILIKGGNDVHLQEIDCKKDLNACFLDRTIGELQIRKISGANLIGLKTEDGQYIYNPSPDIRIQADHKLFALGTHEQIEMLKNVLSNKLKNRTK